MHLAHATHRQSLITLVLRLAVLLVLSTSVHATAPSFSGLAALVPNAGGTINLRSQGVLAGTAPLKVVSASPLPLALGIRVTVVNGVCVQITNTTGLDLAALGVLLNVVVTNADAPQGIRGVIPVLGGTSSNNNLALCADTGALPVANAGPNRTIADTDGVAGEVVTLNGSASSAVGGTITSYLWTDLSTGQTLGTGAQINPRIADGDHQIQLTVTGSGGTASTTIAVVVAAAAAARGPTANAGVNRGLIDTDSLAGELVTLDASASIDLGGTITSYEWLDSQLGLLGTGVVLTLRLPDGVNNLVLRVIDSNQLSDTVSLTITVASLVAGNLLSAIPNLTPNQKSVASTLDDLCSRLQQFAEQQPLLPEQIDLLNRCNGIIAVTNGADQVGALDNIGANDFIAIRTQALLFANTQNFDILSRMTELRRGVRGIDARGLTVGIDGKPVPFEQLAEVAKKIGSMLGGGASADDVSGSLLSEKLGIWLRGNYDSADRSVSPSNSGFEGNQWGLTGGVDYRFAQRSVLGVAVGYGRSSLDFNPVGRGSLDTKSWTGSVYGSTYLGRSFYLDAVINHGRAHYDTSRHIVYQESGSTIDRTAIGRTPGTTLSGGISVGYDFNFGGLTLSPALGYFRSHAKVDAFSEQGANGLDLAYDNQNYSSSTANLNLTVNYVYNTRWFVLLPHVRGEYVHELNNDVEVFGVRFAHDPFANAANPTPLVVVSSDVPDQWYWRLAAGLSAQFKFGVAAYVEYQKMEDFQYVTFKNLTLGLRLQQSF